MKKSILIFSGLILLLGFTAGCSGEKAADEPPRTAKEESAVADSLVKAAEDAAAELDEKAEDVQNKVDELLEDI